MRVYRVADLFYMLDPNHKQPSNLANIRYRAGREFRAAVVGRFKFERTRRNFLYESGLFNWNEWRRWHRFHADKDMVEEKKKRAGINWILQYARSPEKVQTQDIARFYDSFTNPNRNWRTFEQRRKGNDSPGLLSSGASS